MAVDPFLADTLPSDGQEPSSPTTRRELGRELCGQQLHHFRVDELIGRGGMGSVYRAHDLSLDRPVALKVINGRVIDDSNLRERFIREARSQARMSHANVVQIYYVGRQENLDFFAMELVEGASLEDLLAGGAPPNWQIVLEQMIDVAKALRLAHERGIVHRDIKPSNLLIDGEGAVKVADFGLAKWVHDDAKITQEGRILGTPMYMSPEQGQGEETDHRSDIYSLGATFYHLLSGRPPFDAKTPMGIVVKHITQPLPSLRERAAEVPETLTSVIERMMAKDPEKRFASYDELIAALEKARPRATTPAGFWVRAIALFVDFVIMAFAMGFLESFGLILYVAYFVVGWWRRGQTVGKWIFRIQVRDLEGGTPSIGKTLARFAVYNAGPLLAAAFVVSLKLVTGRWPMNLPDDHPMLIALAVGMFFIGILVASAFGVAAFRRDRRAVHDLIAGTKVVYKLDS